MLDAEEREQVRRGLKVLVDEAPMAPDFETITAPRLRPAGSKRWSPPLVFAATALLIAILGGLAVFLSGGQTETAASPETTAPTPTTAPAPDPAVTTSPDSTPTTTLPLPALEPGEFPRVMIDLPDWTISYIEDSEGETENGLHHHSTIRLTDGSTDAELRLNSGPFVDLEGLITDRLNSGTRTDDQAVLKSEAVVVRYNGSSTFTAMWSDNGVEYEFVADTNEETVRSLLQALTRVSEADWVAALPDTIISDRSAAVRKYLADIPLPPGLDPTALEEGPIESWYQVGADTVSAVACGWTEHWINAKAAGDQASTQQAVDAMAGSREWDILIDMAAEGAFSDVVWEYADAIATDGTVIGGRVLTVEESYTDALGCNTS